MLQVYLNEELLQAKRKFHQKESCSEVTTVSSECMNVLFICNNQYIEEARMPLTRRYSLFHTNTPETIQQSIA